MTKNIIIYLWAVFLISCDHGNALEIQIPQEPSDPYLIVIGGSVSEGHPTRHGRLHSGGPVGFVEDLESMPGQISYDLANILNMRSYNHGIGGQTTVQIRNRWSRDVLGQPTAVGDGLPDSTFKEPELPVLVYLHVGGNDIALGIHEHQIKDNFRFFAQSCRDNGIDLIVANMGVNRNFQPHHEVAAIRLNFWLHTEFIAEFPEVIIADYMAWSSEGTYNIRHNNTTYFQDAAHPNLLGYMVWSEIIADTYLDKQI